MNGCLPPLEARQDSWTPGFDPGRCLVHAKLGPIERFYLRPQRFRRRFYHRLHPLPIEPWRLHTRTVLHGNLCILEITLNLRFQATLGYVEKHPGSLPKVNEHIRRHMEPLVLDAIDEEMVSLADGGWIESGLGESERRIAMRINETMILNQVQCRALCSLNPHFSDLSGDENTAFIHQQPYLNILRKRFEFEKARLLENTRQMEEQLDHELEQLRLTLEAAHRKQTEDAKHRRKRLESKRRQSAERWEIERKMHHENLLHRARMEEMTLDRKLQQARRRREVEARLRAEKQAHLKAMKRSERQARRHHKQRLAEYSMSLQDRLQAFLNHKDELRQLEFEAAKKLREKQEQIAALEKQLESIESERNDASPLILAPGSDKHGWLNRLAHMTGRVISASHNRH